ncbi:MAG: FAD:protein FMN transferase [Candidatus Krumholzibacteriia bacterium]
MSAAWLVLLAVGGAAAPADAVAQDAAPPPAVHEEARYLMGTLATVRAEAPAAATAQAAVDAAWAAFALVDSLMSTWREDSDLVRANAGAAAGPVRVDPRLAGLAARALDLAAASDGAFDPTVLPLMRAWGLRDGPPRRPDAAALGRARSAVGHRLVQVDTVAATVAFARPGTALDLGGIAKGYALDLARAAMAAAGAAAGVLDLGGNLLVFGAGAHEVGIVAPDDPAAVVATVTVGEGAVATSGQYERFVAADGERWGHILDPRRGEPVPRSGSVTIVAPTGELADALATAVFVLGPREGAAFAARFPGVGCVFVTAAPDGGWAVVRSGAPDPGRSR